jgi:DNA polymerase type B, organellar and viral
LAINFNVDEKGIFPYKFVNNKDISLHYNGAIPNRESLKELSEEDYITYCSNYKDNKWNFRYETIKYCEQDVVILYQIISIFQKKIYSLFRMDILKDPTISSLALGILSTKLLC